MSHQEHHVIFQFKACNTGTCLHTHLHTRLTALCPGLPRWAGIRKVKPIWILLEQETVSGSGISWAIRKSAPCSRQITMPALHYSSFYRLDALPAAQPTVSKHWRHLLKKLQNGQFMSKFWQQYICELKHHITHTHLTALYPGLPG